MSWYPRRRVFDGNFNVFRNLPSGGGSATSTPTPSAPAAYDGNANLSANSFLQLETLTTASSTPIVLTLGSSQVQTITGSAAQTLRLPITGIKAGALYVIVCQNLGATTVQAGDGTTIAVLPVGTIGVFRAWLDGANDIIHWVADVRSINAAFSVFNNQLAITHGGTQTLWPLPSAAAPAPSTLAQWNPQANLAANAFFALQTSTAASASPIALTIASTQVQIVTGTTTPQTVLLATTGVPAGYQQVVINQMTTASVTVQASDGTVIDVLAPNQIGVFRARIATPTTSTHWGVDLRAGGPLGTPASGNLLNCAGLPVSGVTNLVSAPFELFTTTNIGSPPAGATALIVEELIAPGSGGGSGRRGAASTIRCGGGGGGSGAKIENLRIPVSLLPSAVTVTLPAAGTGGAAVTADNTNGNPGTAGAAASVSSGSNIWSTFGGTAGAGGTATSGAAGALGQGPLNGSSGGAASATGGVGSPGGSSVNGAPSGGGAGGGISATDVASNGGNGGVQTMQYGLSAAAGGIVGGASPGNGNAQVAGIGGNGGGGGAASTTGAAQSGGTSPGYGAGGTGGGASVNGNNSGAGTAGGPAYFRGRWSYV